MAEVVAQATPPEAVVAVVSKGDSRLLELAGREGRHFPADADGRYAGYYPRTSEEAIARIEAARRAGAEYLCLPATALWWLEHYGELATWLGARCEVAAEDRETCILYDLLHAPEAGLGEPGGSSDGQLRALLGALLPESCLVLAIGLNGESLEAPGRTIASLGRGNAAGLRRRLERSGGLPTFVLVLGGDSGPPSDPALERLLAETTRTVARRPGLCDLFEANSAVNVGKLRPATVGAVDQVGTGPGLGSQAADKLSRRLERLGLAGDDGPSPRGEEQSDG